MAWTRSRCPLSSSSYMAPLLSASCCSCSSSACSRALSSWHLCTKSRLSSQEKSSAFDWVSLGLCLTGSPKGAGHPLQLKPTHIPPYTHIHHIIHTHTTLHMHTPTLYIHTPSHYIHTLYTHIAHIHPPTMYTYTHSHTLHYTHT